MKKEDLKELLEEIVPGVDYDTETGLVEKRLITSLQLVMIVSRLADEFDVEISPERINPENFDSLDRIYELLISCGEE